LLIFLAVPLLTAAQEEPPVTVSADTASRIIYRLETGSLGDNVTVTQDPRLTRILRKHYEFNRSTGISGWRILIYKGRDMSKANQAKASFEEAFRQLSLPVGVEYNEPDFSTVVGSFRSKEDAYRYKQMLMVRFPQAYLVPAKIRLE
jgi:hypothetical protein